MVTEYNRNTIIKRRMEELERKAKDSSIQTAPIVEAVETPEKVITESVEESEKPKKTDAEKLTRRKKQG